jgi:putative peptide maturation system protein
MTLSDELKRAADRGLILLDHLNAERVPPERTAALVAALGADFPSLRFELVWEREPCKGQIHYDLLLFTASGESLSLNLCPAQSLPWPLRGALPNSDGEIVRVGTRKVRVAEVISYLDFVWQDRRLVSRIVDTAIIDAELEARPIAVEDEELQDAMDEFRIRRGLLTEEATDQWLERNCLTHGRLEQIVELDCRVARLRARIAAGRVEAQFATDPTPFRRVVVALVDLPTVEEAWRFVGAAERAGFWSAAEIELGRRGAAGRALPPLLQTFDLASAAPEIRPLFDLEVGALVPPTRLGEGYAVGKIIAHQPATLDAATHRRIEEQLFDAWLAAQRSAADVEWYWGDVPAETG